MTLWKCVTRHFYWIAVILITTAAMSGCRQDDGVRNAPIQPISDPIAQGRLTYETYCMSCHGEEGKGDGPVAEMLTVPPTNLTLLTQSNNGLFPTTTVYNQIDGREDIRAHGTREMPVWGNIWSEIDGVPQPEENMQKQIGELVEYLRSIQDSTVSM